MKDELIIPKSNEEISVWINDQLLERPVNVPLENYISLLLTKLNMLSNDLTKDIHQKMQNLVPVLPPTQVHVTHFQARIQVLQEILATVKNETSLAQQETHLSVELISALDQSKMNMTVCADKLAEAAKWSKGVREMSEKFSSGRLDTVADELNSMRSSLHILKDMPEAEEREETMKSLCTRLEALAKPKLLEALEEDSVTLIRQFVSIYRHLGQEGILQKEYAKSRQAPIHRFWFSCITSQEPCRQWLPSFYDKILSLMEREMGRCEEIFGNVAECHVLISLLEEMLLPLEDSFRDRLKQDFSLAGAIEAHTATAQFVVKLCETIKCSSDISLVNPILSACFKPYEGINADLEGLCEQDLTNFVKKNLPNLDSVQGSSGNIKENSFEDEYQQIVYSVIQQLDESFPVIFEKLETCLDQCIEFSAGAYSPAALNAISNVISKILTSFTSSVIPQLKSLSMGSHEETSSPGLSNGGDFNWAHFHSSLELLQHSGILTRNLESCNTKLRLRLREKIANLLDNLQPSFTYLELNQVSLLNARLTLDSNPIQARKLKNLLFTLNEENPPKCIPQAFTCMQRWNSSVQSLAYDLVQMPVRSTLTLIPNIENWSKKTDDESRSIPSYGLLPQEYITSVADLLLSILPQLQPFEDNASIGDVCLACEKLFQLAANEWTQLSTILELTSDEKKELETMTQSQYHTNEQDLTLGIHFVDNWTCVFASGAVGILISSLMKIENLTNMGSSQLNADLVYFNNVLTALGIEIHPILLHLQKLLQMESDQHKQLVLESNTDCGVLHKISKTIAKKRGILVSFE